MSRPTKLLLVSALLLCAPLAVAQSNLGELLDVGARKLTVDEFKAELVQRRLVGQTPSGAATLEIFYGKNGAIAGEALNPDMVGLRRSLVNGRPTTMDGYARASHSPEVQMKPSAAVSSGSNTTSSISFLSLTRTARPEWYAAL